eukprot:6179156-Pleurochrysis_carterae.AAC.2
MAVPLPDVEEHSDEHCTARQAVSLEQHSHRRRMRKAQPCNCTYHLSATLLLMFAAENTLGFIPIYPSRCNCLHTSLRMNVCMRARQEHDVAYSQQPRDLSTHNPADTKSLHLKTRRRGVSLFGGLVGSAALISGASLSWTAFPSSAAAADADEVAATLRDVEWEETPPFSREDFRRLDESSDSDFYAAPRLVYHIDERAAAAAKTFYGTLFRDVASRRYGGEHALDVLDLCSSWISHYPSEGKYRRVAGLGMNAEELRANPLLSEHVVRDLNKQPALPYADSSFDAVTCTVSIDYLTRPLDVIREVSRVLRPGGSVAILFSDRLFFSKAVALWTGKDDLEHVYTVGSYIHYGAGDAMGAPRAVDLTPKPLRGIPSFGGAKRNDPLYAVVADKL